MICKRDVSLWFKELESYKRIDTMCTLLSMCLPFELRFLGTFLEDLGRKDSQELRGMELRVNNPQDLATDMVACQKGEPTDKKVRRKMALYLALIRACNRTCVMEIFRTLDGWGERDFQSMDDPDTLQELLLVYTMAANHPVFSFEQHLKCTEIFEKIKQNRLVADQAMSQQLQQQQLQQQQHQQQRHPQNIDHTLTPGPQHQQDLLLQPSPQELIQNHSLPTVTYPAHYYIGNPPNLVVQHLNFSPSHPTKFIPPEGTIQHQISTDHSIPLNMIPGDAMIPHPWSARTYLPPGSTIDHPPQSSSPMPSQQSSPSSSRTTSPNRNSNNNMVGPMLNQPPPQQQQQQQTQQQVRNIPQRIGPSLKNVRRPSSETTPPPMGQQQQQQQHQQIMSNEINLPQNIKHMDDVVMNNEGSGSNLQTLIRNGFRGTVHPQRIKSNFILSHQQQQSPVNQPQQFQVMPLGNFTVPTMQTMPMVDGSNVGTHMMDGMSGMNSNKSTGSDAGSSIGSPDQSDQSPPETPTPSQATTGIAGVGRLSGDQQQSQQQKHHQQQQQQLGYNKQIMGLQRLNGRSEKLLTAGGGGGSVGIAPNAPLYLPAYQPTAQLFGTDIIMQNPVASNNNSNAGSSIASVNNSSNMGPNNNNMGTNAVLISSPSAVTGGGIIGNLITSNSIIVPQQQQYNSTFPYAPTMTAQHMSTARPPLIPHNPGIPVAPPRYQTHNGEFFPPYPYSGAPGVQQVAIRTSSAVPTSGNSTAVLPQPQPQPQLQQPPPPPQQQQPPPQLQVTQAPVPSGALLATYSPLPVGVSNKPVSCYNCGSQTHNGRDCQEASMDDVTRSAVYKLDYSVSSNASPTTSTISNMVSTGSSGGSTADTLQSSTQLLQKLHLDNVTNVATNPSAPTASTLSSSTAAINTK